MQGVGVLRRKGSHPGVQTSAHDAAQQIETTKKVLPDQAFRFAVAPMMDWTDRRCRAFHRILTRRAAALYRDGDRRRRRVRPARAAARVRPRRAPGGAAARRIGPEAARGGRADRRRFRLRRDQPQLRLPVRPGAERPVRRLPDARAGAGRRLRRGDEGRGRGSRHGQVPHRSGRPGAGSRAACLRRGGEGGGRRRARGPRSKGLARRPEPEGQPHRAAARLRAGLRAEARASGLADHPQRRPCRSRRRARGISPTSTA